MHDVWKLRILKALHKGKSFYDIRRAYLMKIIEWSFTANEGVVFRAVLSHFFLFFYFRKGARYALGATPSPCKSYNYCLFLDWRSVLFSFFLTELFLSKWLDILWIYLDRFFFSKDA